MTEQTFRSPGFFEREIDLSARSKTIEGVPAGVIGTAQRGPAFVPVTVGSFLDFERKFGTLDPEMFGPYAVNAFLQKRTALTYVRVLGAGANSTTTDIQTTDALGTVKNAGFRIVGSVAGTASGYAGKIGSVSANEARHEGSVQFILACHDVLTSFETVGYPAFTDNNTFNVVGGNDVALVRGMVLMASGARLQVLDDNENYSFSAVANDVAKISAYDGSQKQGTFKLILSSALGSSFGSDENKFGVRILTASLDPTSNFYISKILNTNPDRFKTEQHLLYGDFAVESELAKVSQHNTNYSVAVASGSALTTSAGDGATLFRDLFGSFNTRYQTAKTTSFISQPFGTTEYDLFHFESLDDGAAGNRRVKVSISNLRRSTNPRNPYGTFNVLVRDFTDTDVNLKVLEQYTDCTLDPADDNYIANMIGDMKVTYNFDAESESERRVNVTGKRPNKSGLVRVVMTADVEDGQVPETALPFGFRGLPTLKLNDAMIDESTQAALPGGSKRLRLGYKHAGTSIFDNGGDQLKYAVLPPVPMRFKTTKGAVNKVAGFTGYPGKLELSDSRLFWGIKFERLPLTGSLSNAVLYSNASSTPNPLISTYSKLLGIQKMDVLHTGSAADLFNDNKFSLAKVALNNVADPVTYASLSSAVTQYITGSPDLHMREAAYLRDKTPSTPLYDVADGGSAANRLTFASLVSADSATAFNKFGDYLKFTNMMYGGFDGLNILDRDQRLMNDKASSSDEGGKAAGTALSYEHLNSLSDPGSGVDNNSVASYRVAASILTDPMASRVNIISVPGIRDSFVTDHVSELTRDYSKAIYLMDIPAYDDTPTRLYDDATTRPNVRKSVEQFEGRAIDNNYVATYFPDVIKNDPINNEAVNMPASIAAVGALAHNDSVAYPWFAPAGFNRGALEDVINTEIRLNTEDRNVLYDARINPIANFPNGGHVIFGQKTLQQARSALDRVNVRRMLLEVKRIVSDIANKIIFEQNTPSTRARFVAQVTPLLSVIQSQQGINQFKVVMDSSNNSQEDIEQNRLNGRIILVPTRAVEFIAMDFIITNSGVSFE